MSYPIIHGQYQRHRTAGCSTPVVPSSLLHQRYFTIQATNGIDEKKHDEGCSYRQSDCARIILVREMNFVRCCSDWDLYVVTGRSSLLLLQLILVPYTLHRNECQEFHDWTYIGSCRANAIRLDVEACVLMYRKHRSCPYGVECAPFKTTHTNTREATGSSYCNWYIDAYMDSMVDESIASVSTATFSSSSLVPLSNISNLPIADVMDDECHTTIKCDKENNSKGTVLSFEKTCIEETATSTATVDATLLPSQTRQKTRRRKKRYQQRERSTMAHAP